MSKRRSSAVLVVVVGAVTLALALGACASRPDDERGGGPSTSVTSPGDDSDDGDGSTSTTARDDDGTTSSSTSTSSTSTTSTLLPETTTTTAPPPPSDEPPVLAAGVKGPRTQALQQRLVELKYDPGPVDGEFGTKTKMAVWAYQKLAGVETTGEVTPELWATMSTTANPPAPFKPDGGPNRVEVDLGKQVLVVYQDNAAVLITHVSSGNGKRYCEGGSCGVAVTPKGDYSVLRRIDGWRESRLGLLYNPLYFKGGYAIHGAPSVPNYPASHGCVRIPMHIAEYFPDLVSNGEPVYLV